jgi:hypothetical protein
MGLNQAGSKAQGKPTREKKAEEVSSVILHEMGHNARRDSHDNEPPEFFRKCNLGCAQPGRFQ